MKKQKAESCTWSANDDSIRRLTSLLPDRSHDELVQMFQNYIRKTAGLHSARIPPVFLKFRDALSDEWRRRYEHFLSRGVVDKWPTTDAPYIGGSLDTRGWPSEGMLRLFGYHVGETSGVNEPLRRQILDEIFSIYLPPINDPPYMRKWALPKALSRLQCMAETIASLTRIAKRRPNMKVACEGWESDLAYLFSKYRVAYFGLDRGRTFNDLVGWTTDIAC